MTKIQSLPMAVSSGGRQRHLTLVAALFSALTTALSTTHALAQAPAAAAGSTAVAASAEVLEGLVDRIALYPDDLVGIILPASTNPLQLVQADRYLEKRMTDPKLAVHEAWDDAVKSLLNYPEIVRIGFSNAHIPSSWHPGRRPLRPASMPLRA